jgi:TIR domain
VVVSPIERRVSKKEAEQGWPASLESRMPFVDPHNYKHDRVDIFISGSHADGKIEVLAEKLKGSGFSIFHSGLGLPPGLEYTVYIQHYLEHSKTILVCWSNHSVRSEWVNAEAEYARVNNRLVACKIETCHPLPPFNTFQTVDLSGWKGDDSNTQWARLLDLLKHRSSGKLSEFSQLAGVERQDGRKKANVKNWFARIFGR